MSLTDQATREHATEPNRSFIVQAPAGSGKTEILTQRYLRLLSTVDSPEQIIALTFTRKAANEMRERIVLTLQQVANGQTATSAHQEKTYTFASAALSRDATLNWQLLLHPNRLQIMTIDSLCQTLTHAIPMVERSLHHASVSDKPDALYFAAAHACLCFAENEPAYQPALETLLYHLDNRVDHLLTTWCDLLSKRDQWLNLIYPARQQDKAIYEYALSCIQHHALQRLQTSLTSEETDQLITLINRFVNCVGHVDDAILLNLNSLTQLNHQQIERLTALLLTTQNTLRKSFDHHVGLKRGVCHNDDYDEIKSTSKLLFAHLNELPAFLEALIRIKDLPQPVYHPEQWATLQALFTLLPLLVAHLNLVFNEHECVDFSSIAHSASIALGDEQQPTDLALYLDHHIHHILVDEFQDTSLQQFHLLQQLVHGWQQGDGRTLFLVGDPMQSIYRFRSAEVGLFLRTREQGLGQIQLIPLELCCNFRSTQTIVNWINTQFKSIFPQTNDIESGAVAFHASEVLTKAHAPEASYIKAFQCQSRTDEAEVLVQCIREELTTYPHDNIAILVRSRRQLTEIIHILREQDIPFQGVDIDLLANLPHLRDVWSLTEALLMPANRLAWLALLRSPWCGLSLMDLHAIANFAKSQSIYHALSHLTEIKTLSAEGQTRATFIFAVLDRALSLRHQYSLVDWIIQTLTDLHLEYVLNSSQQDDLEQFWLLLEQLERAGQIEDLALFKLELSKLYSKQVTPSRLQIMTIHKSKGLEFDCVILPGLGTKLTQTDKTLLRWLKLPTQKGELMLFSPMKAAHHEYCPLYDYLGKLDGEKDYYESQRLLYVATTRAKKRLFLFDSSVSIRQGTFRDFLQNQDFITGESHVVPAVEDQIAPEQPKLYHLPLDFYGDTTRIISNSLDAVTPHWTMNSIPRFIGVVAHELLQWICDHHPDHFNEIPWNLALYQLKNIGLVGEELEQAFTMIQQQLFQFFHAPEGQWIRKYREDEHNEYALLVKKQDEIVTRIIDRTFSEDGVRWIIDFKTGHEDKIKETQHRAQVNEYAELLTQRFNQTTRCGLYYLSSSHWVTWE